jgi:hypothetical protein
LPLDGGTQQPSGPIALPGTFKIFDRTPTFGMYRTNEPPFTPPAAVLMWSHGTAFVSKLSREHRRKSARISKRTSRITPPGLNRVRLDIEPARVPPSSYYATSISFSSP